MIATHGRDTVLACARTALQHARDKTIATNIQALLEHMQTQLKPQTTVYTPVINATGVVLHTNLGRAPLPQCAWQAMQAAAGYCDLELDLDHNTRASRLRDLEPLLCEVTGAEAGLVVNNNAAAVMLALAALAGTRPVAISRGHMIEIGGGCRLPDILQASGCALLEIGTANRTHLSDYAKAIAQGAAAILVVHRANFVLQGYVSEPPVHDLATLAHQHHIPLIMDLGSGLLVSMAGEPRVQDALAWGADIVCFSGDKLVGGPQAGYIVGPARYISALRAHPLTRALRCDKLQLSAAAAVLDVYRRGRAAQDIPVWRMIEASVEALHTRVEQWRNTLQRGALVETVDAIGGGAMPQAQLPGVALAIRGADALLARLRQHSVMARIERDHVLLHARTVLDEQDAELIEGIRQST